MRTRSCGARNRCSKPGRAGGTAWLPGSLIDRLGLRQGDRLKIIQAAAKPRCPLGAMTPIGGLRAPASGCRETAGLGAMLGLVSLERVAAQQRVTA